MRVAESRTDSLPADELRLIQQAQLGDRQAFAVLIQRYWDRLFRWLYHLCHERHTAEDLTQDAFLKAFANVSSFRPGTNFRAWLFRIAHNAFLNLQRGNGRLRPFTPDQHTTRIAGPDRQALNKEAMGAVSEAMQRLPAEFRSALLLRAVEGLSFREIAAVVQTTEVTARWRVFKARQKLTEIIGPYLNGDEP
jgi:RNA polymerase sigma-70 factor (ECF subfamily)